VSTVLLAVSVRHLALKVLLKRNFDALIEELRIHSAQTLSEEGVSTGKFQEKLWLVW
jgi:hypothetical protein